MHRQLLNVRPQAILFDLDGTLIDTAGDFINVIQRLRHSEGLPALNDSFIRQHISDGVAGMVPLTCHATDALQSGERVDRFLEAYSRQLGYAAQPYPGMHALIKHLGRQRVSWGIVTNKRREYAEPLIAMMHFKPAADCLITPCDVERPKPYPDAIIHACNLLNVDQHKTIYIGDHQRDIDAGRAAGCFTVAATYGYIAAGDNPDNWAADVMVPSPLELTSMLMRMLP